MSTLAVNNIASKSGAPVNFPNGLTVGTGSKFDPDSTVPMPAGAFVTHFGKQVHYDGAKDEDTWLEIVGMGPATATDAETK